MMTLILTLLLGGSAVAMIVGALAEVRRSEAETRLVQALERFEDNPGPVTFLCLRFALDAAKERGVYLGTWQTRIDTAVAEAPLQALLGGWNTSLRAMTLRFEEVGAAAKRLQQAFAEMGEHVLRFQSAFRDASMNPPIGGPARSMHR